MSTLVMDMDEFDDMPGRPTVITNLGAAFVAGASAGLDAQPAPDREAAELCASGIQP